MIELIAVAALILLVRYLVNLRTKKNQFSAVEKENNAGKQDPASIIGKSTFVLGSNGQKPALIEKLEGPVSGSSGKMEIEVPLDYEPDTGLLEELEEQEELERLGLQTGYSSNITFEEMMSVVNEVGNEQTETSPETGKLLYENENTDWVEQLASASPNYQKRIAGLIDLHLGRLGQPISDEKPDDGLSGFDIGEYVG